MERKTDKKTGGLARILGVGALALMTGCATGYPSDLSRTAEMSTGMGAMSAAYSGNRKLALGMGLMNSSFSSIAAGEEHHETMNAIKNLQEQQNQQAQNNNADNKKTWENSPGFFACNYWKDVNGDGYAQRDEYFGEGRVFYDDQKICLTGDIGKKPYQFTLLNDKGEAIAGYKDSNSRESPLQRFDYEPGKLPAGNYTALWYSEGRFAGKAEITVLAREKKQVVAAAQRTERDSTVAYKNKPIRLMLFKNMPNSDEEAAKIASEDFLDVLAQNKFAGSYSIESKSWLETRLDKDDTFVKEEPNGRLYKNSKYGYYMVFKDDDKK